ncbi:MAG: hypothetical protein HY326_04710 [Chloroflexi bacterium]|nr:hypothetical protein [Chloroflexota bacterium]
MHVIEVNQSIKIEQSGATILAFSNGISHAILIPQSVKQKALAVLKERGKTKDTARNLLFCACLYLLLKDHLEQIEEVVIDEEYTGNDRSIRSFLLEYIKRDGRYIEPERIVFARIGKGSPADKKARMVRSGKDQEYRVVTLEELLEVVQ